MKRASLLIVAMFVAISTFADNLSISQLVKLANSSSISAISSIASSNGYKLVIKRAGAKGWEGCDVTDFAWAYNAQYIEAINSWKFQGNYSVIKLLYNNTTHKPEIILYEFSSSYDFQLLKQQISKYGYEFYQEDINAFPNGIAYCFHNDELHMFAIFVEHSDNSGFQIHFYRE